jgi:hypothetical protein
MPMNRLLTWPMHSCETRRIFLWFLPLFSRIYGNDCRSGSFRRFEKTVEIDSAWNHPGYLFGNDYLLFCGLQTGPVCTGGRSSGTPADYGPHCPWGRHCYSSGTGGIYHFLGTWVGNGSSPHITGTGARPCISIKKINYWLAKAVPKTMNR